MKCRSVKPKPWEVRRKRTVLGRGQENGSSSVGGCAAAESAMILQSGDSFCTWRKEGKGNSNQTVWVFFLCYEILKLNSVSANVAEKRPRDRRHGDI